MNVGQHKHGIILTIGAFGCLLMSIFFSEGMVSFLWSVIAFIILMVASKKINEAREQKKQQAENRPPQP